MVSTMTFNIVTDQEEVPSAVLIRALTRVGAGMDSGSKKLKHELLLGLVSCAVSCKLTSLNGGIYNQVNRCG